MRYSEARQGRIFILRLEDGEIVHEVIETFAREKGVKAASLIILGGADDSSRLVVGPEEDRELPLTPMIRELTRAHEVAGVGTIFCDDNDTPTLHMHMACGRWDMTTTGCVRAGVKVWRVMEVIIHEIVETGARRKIEAPLNIPLLQP